jgi:hypothetical protein
MGRKTRKEFQFMKPWQIAGALALGIGALAAGAGMQPFAAAQGGSVNWLDSWEAGQSAARASGKPIFLVFR